MKVRVKKMHANAKIPQAMTDGAAAFDLTCVEAKKDNRYYTVYYTGLAFEIPKGYVGLLFPRSSISNTCFTLANCVGVLDSDYRGEVTFRFRTVSDQPVYRIGDRIGQLLIISRPRIDFEETDDLTVTSRGAGGYGSSGK